MILSTTSPSTVSTITSASSEPSACVPSLKPSTRSRYRPTTTLLKPVVPPASSSVSLPAPAPISFRHRVWVLPQRHLRCAQRPADHRQESRAPPEPVWRQYRWTYLQEPDLLFRRLRGLPGGEWS